MAEDKGIDTEKGGLPKDQPQNSIPPSGRQLGGGPGYADMTSGAGSSGTGGYGNAQNQQLHQGQHDDSMARQSDERLSRGEAFDEQQGGGCGPDSVSIDRDQLARDQREHQDRGQSIAKDEADR